MMLECFVPGNPKAQPRARAFGRKIGGKVTARMYDPGTADGWKGLIALEFRKHLQDQPVDVPVHLELCFLFDRPKRLLRKSSPKGKIIHGSKPDIDNLAKDVMDTLTSIGFWRDDTLVYSSRLSKYYAAIDGRPGVLIRIKTVEDNVA